MNDKLKYYSLLGIRPTNDAKLIKKAYRKLAFKYHPDRNSSPEAHVKFIEVTRAYEILTGQKEQEISKNYQTKTKEEILKEKIRLAEERYRQMVEAERRKEAIYYKKVAFGWKWTVFKVCAAYTLIFTILLTIDYFADGDSKTLNHKDLDHGTLDKMLTAEGLARWVKDEKARAKYVEAFQKSDFEAMLNYYKRNYPKEPYTLDTSEVIKVKCPVLMIHGLDDWALLHPALNGTWEWLEKDLTLITVPHAGHFVQQDATDMVNRSIRMWLNR